MPEKSYIEPNELTYEILTDKHDLSCFDCSFQDEIGLNEFIHKEVRIFKEKTWA